MWIVIAIKNEVHEQELRKQNEVGYSVTVSSIASLIKSLILETHD